MSQKRVAMVLASLVGTLTVSAGMLLLMEGGALGTSPMGAAVEAPQVVLPNVPLRSEPWKFIIIYESADLAGDAASLADGRVIGGSESSPNTVRPRVNFHFVIDSPRSKRGAEDGKLEIGTAWTRQDPGAPYAGWRDLSPYSVIPPYNGSVGICMIGDLNREPISRAQSQRLVSLVQELKQSLNLSDDCVRFQWEFAGQATPAQKAYAENFRRSAGIRSPVE